MEILIGVVSHCFVFGCGWVAGVWFFKSTQDEVDHPKTTFLNPIPATYKLPITPKIKLNPTRGALSPSGRTRGALSPIQIQRRGRTCGRTRRRQKCKRRRNQRCISDKKEERERLIEAFKEHTGSIENLDATLTVLNKILKKAEIVNHIESKETDYDIIEGETDRVVSALKNPGMRILFPSQTNPLLPDFGGPRARCPDKSANMHIYDSNFKAPKCDENSWSLKTDRNEVINENVCKEFGGSNKPNLRGEEYPSAHSELRGMFQDCREGDSIKTPSSSVSNTQPGNMLTKPGGGYASMGDLNKIKKEVTLDVIEKRPKKKSKDTGTSEGSEKRLSRGDELDIINSFSSMKGMGWGEAVNLAQEQGYNLHATYINELPNYRSEYSKTVLGVRVKDMNFDCRLGSDHKGFSKDTVVISVIDVGGQDERGRGL